MYNLLGATSGVYTLTIVICFTIVYAWTIKLGDTCILQNKKQ